MVKEKQISLILEVVSYVEANLQNPMTVQDICNQTPYSSWQFQRLFRAYAKDSLGSYLRSRRLTLAAEEIISFPDRRILDVAIQAQFASQEAFTRAFKEHFNVTPSEIKNHPGILRLKKKPRLTSESLSHIQHGIALEPQIINQELIHFAGLVTSISSPLSHTKDYIEEAPKLWHEFNLRRKEITNRIRALSYGIAISEEGDMLDEKMTYFAGVRVTSLDAIPANLNTLTIPSQQIAMFKKVGHETSSHLTIDYIYGIWLPNSGYKRGQGYDYEIFGPEFSLENSNSVSTYCLPITPDL